MPTGSSCSTAAASSAPAPTRSSWSPASRTKRSSRRSSGRLQHDGARPGWWAAERLGWPWSDDDGGTPSEKQEPRPHAAPAPGAPPPRMAEDHPGDGAGLVRHRLRRRRAPDNRHRDRLDLQRRDRQEPSGGHDEGAGARVLESSRSRPGGADAVGHERHSRTGHRFHSARLEPRPGGSPLFSGRPVQLGAGLQHGRGGAARGLREGRRRAWRPQPPRLPPHYFDSHPHGHLLSRVTNDIDNVTTTLQQGLSQLRTSALTIVGVLGMMLWISHLLALISLVTVPLSVGVTLAVARRSQKQFGAQWAWTGSVNALVEQTHTGHALVQVFGRTRRAMDD